MKGLIVAATTKRTPRKASKRVAKKSPAKKRATARKTTRAKAPRKRNMTTQHKSALAKGRSESSVVRAYLEALEAHKPKRGRQVTPDDLRNRIDTLREQAAQAKASDRLKLVQDRINLEQRLESMEVGFDITALKEGFVKVAKAYAVRKGISYSAFREVGVSAAVLQEAGITRSM